jgi:hypothetical protein
MSRMAFRCAAVQQARQHGWLCTCTMHLLIPCARHHTNSFAAYGEQLCRGIDAPAFAGAATSCAKTPVLL